jgi:decaprenyl-phosphate phosphoribosyltransferase
LANIPFAIIKTARPRQWVKNLSIFAALVFTGEFFNPDLFWKTVEGFLTLSVIVSSIYFINDIADVKVDKLHPFKKNRPIAKGDLPIPLALFLAVVGVVVALFVASMLSTFFFLALLAYLILQIAYTFYLKELS